MVTLEKILLISILIQTLHVCCVEFNRSVFGVGLIPFVKHAAVNGKIPKITSYTFENVQTMLEVVTTKFSRVFIESVYADDAPYERNFSYYRTNTVVTRIAEAAALLNLKRNQTALTVLVGVYDEPEQQNFQLKAEAQVAIEAIEIANKIYAGTVSEIVLVHPDPNGLEWANTTLTWVKMLREMTKNLTLRIGTRQPCSGFSPVNSTTADVMSNMIYMIRKQIVMESDFIMCLAYPGDTNLNRGAKYSYSVLAQDLRRERLHISKINPNIKVMWYTWWPGLKNDSWNTIKNLRIYWEELNEFATQEEFPVWQRFAFDAPLADSPNSGWWNLTHNDLINDVSGYMEKVTGKLVQYQNSSENVFANVGLFAAVVASAVVVVLFAVYITLKNCNCLRSAVLTKFEIEEFKLGVLNRHMRSDDLGNSPALSLPYNKSLELQKDQLEILWNQILGSGQFGFVCKAIIKTDAEKEVALKMAKQDSCGIALKGLLSEIKLLSYLGEHPNIVSICGAYTAEIEQGVVYLATELCPLGSLKGFLKRLKTSESMDTSSCISETKKDDPIHDLTRWFHEIACGMEYLEQKKVIHADLATRNILLSTERTAKITDFGLSRRLYEYSVYKKGTQEPLPWRWMAPESLKRFEFSVKTDVWSYGVTIWEIFSLGDVPFPAFTWDEEFVKSLECGLRLTQPNYATKEMYNIISSCWRLAPEERPNFAELRAQTLTILSSNKPKSDEI